MAKFISFLGTGNYTTCTYSMQQELSPQQNFLSQPSRFVQIAIFEMLLSRNIEIDEVIIFVTKEAKHKNWDDRSVEGLTINGLATEFSLRFPEHRSRLKAISINALDDENDIWELFDTIYSSIASNTQIYFDITHSFRSIPTVSLVMSNFANKIKQSKIVKLLYGNMVVKYKTNSLENNAITENSIIDLSAMLSLFEWTNAVHTYLRTANCTLMLELLPQMSTTHHIDEPLHNLANQLQKISEAFELCDGNKILPHILEAQKLLTHYINSSYSPSNPIYKPFYVLMESIQKKLSPFKEHNKFMNNYYIVKWCIDHRLYQQGYTILYESTLKAILNFMSLPTDSYRNIHGNAYWITKSAKQRKWKKFNPDEIKFQTQISKGITVLNLTDQQKNKFIDTVQTGKLNFLVELQSLRNDINHNGFGRNDNQFARKTNLRERLYHLNENCAKHLFAYLEQKSK